MTLSWVGGEKSPIFSVALIPCKFTLLKWIQSASPWTTGQHKIYTAMVGKILLISSSFLFRFFFFIFPE
jgi:hypothetical protein